MIMFLLIIIGLCSGCIVSGGAAGLLTSLSLFPRYAGITKTGTQISLYEDISVLGLIIGNLFSIFHPRIPFSLPILILYGLFSGIFLGSWIIALAEISQVFPVFFRRAKISWGFSLIIAFIALGKTSGSLLYYLKNW